MNPVAYEVNFDSIVGPTHNYGGLSYGNLASMDNRQMASNPKEAALQGLEKMRLLVSLGFKQAVLPPHERPHIPTLKNLGFTGTEAEILHAVNEKAPQILIACSSSAAMWAANAATISPSIDSIDQKVHVTPANLSANFHRSIESEFTSQVLKLIFQDPVYFKNHLPLPAGSFFTDEGAANHSRFCHSYGNPGIQLFVFGRYSLQPDTLETHLFPARQTYEASTAVARLHNLYPERVVFAQQNPRAIDAGVFHNDVAAVGNRNVLFYHESAFLGSAEVIDQLNKKMVKFCDTELSLINIPEAKVSLKDAVSTYLFNSQLLSNAEGTMVLFAPIECESNLAVQEVLNDIISDPLNPIKEIHYIDLRESMRNGGGPACLRLRVALTENELAAVHPAIFLNEPLYIQLKEWIHKHYRSQLLPRDLADPQLLSETKEALDELTKILKLGSIYSFQK